MRRRPAGFERPTWYCRAPSAAWRLRTSTPASRNWSARRKPPNRAGTDECVLARVWLRAPFPRRPKNPKHLAFAARTTGILHLRNTEIQQLHTALVDQDVPWLKIPMNNALAVRGQRHSLGGRKTPNTLHF